VAAASRPPDEAGIAPVVPPSASPPEITVKAVVLSIILAAVLAAANAYLGLFAGMTVSASIPAAVVSMAVLRWFRHSNILENNIVQTAASSGEALAAGVIFTVPGLLLLGAWTDFDYWSTTQLALVGGLLGVLFTIPLRRALIHEAKLGFPEGVATAEVLKAGRTVESTESEGRGHPAGGVRPLMIGAVLGGLIKMGESGCRLWSEALEGATAVGRTLFYGGVNLSPALLAVGYIVGLRIGTTVFLGGVLGWLVLLPLLGFMSGVPDDGPALSAARMIWSTQVRYVGIGAMLVGGLWTLTRLRQPIAASLCQLWRVSRARGKERGIPGLQMVRTERDAPLPWLLAPLMLCLAAMAALYRPIVSSLSLALFMTGIMAVAAFLFASVAAYMAGLVGSSSNPVSGVTIATIMGAALLLVLVLGVGHPNGPAATLLIGAVVCCAAAMGGDNLQDLKTGQLVGATPWKQQVMQVIGVVAGALVLAPILSLLQAKYGIGEATPSHPHPLSAPQATLMASLAGSVFGGRVPWFLVGLGAVLGLVIVVWDERLRARGTLWRVPVLAVALGIYLPIKLSAAIFVGGLVAEWVRRQSAGDPGDVGQAGLLAAAGLVTGEALMGILLALPIGLAALWPTLPPDPWKVYEVPPWGAWPGLILVGTVVWWLGQAGRTRGIPPRAPS
jgi:putative OPT family oligopeptide transporter